MAVVRNGGANRTAPCAPTFKQADPWFGINFAMTMGNRDIGGAFGRDDKAVFDVRLNRSPLGKARAINGRNPDFVGIGDVGGNRNAEIINRQGGDFHRVKKRGRVKRDRGMVQFARCCNNVAVGNHSAGFKVAKVIENNDIGTPTGRQKTQIIAPQPHGGI